MLGAIPEGGMTQSKTCIEKQTLDTRNQSMLINWGAIFVYVGVLCGCVSKTI